MLLHFNPNRYADSILCDNILCYSSLVHSRVEEDCEKKDLDFIVFNGHQLFLLLNDRIRTAPHRFQPIHTSIPVSPFDYILCIGLSLSERFAHSNDIDVSDS